MDKFNRLVEGGLQGFSSSAAKQIIRDSAEVTHYINERRGHFSYVQQLMNDKIIDEAKERLKAQGKWIVPEKDTKKEIEQDKHLIKEMYFPSDEQSDNCNEMESLREEISRLRRENDILKNRLR
jgi:heme oxygenase